MNTRSKQVGSIAVFLIVSALLAAAVVGGVYFAQKRGESASASQPVAQQSTGTDQKTPTPSPAAPTDQTAQKAADDAKKQQAAKDVADAKKQADAATTAKQKVADDAKQKQAQAAADAQKKAVTPVPQTSTVPQPAPASATDHLPSTGPSDGMLQLATAALITIVVTAYLRSYQFRFGSLLR